MNSSPQVFLILVLSMLLFTGCSFSMSQPAEPALVVASPTAQIQATATAVSEGGVPTFTPVSAPQESSVVKPTATAIAAVETEVDEDSTSKEKKPALFFFYADWCSACSEMRPVIDKLEPEYSDRIRFIRVNVDDPEARQLVTMAGVRAIPLTLFLTSPNDQGERWVGPRPESVLRAAFDEALTQPSEGQ